MREILFKAKRKDNSEWVEGYYIKVTDIYTSFADFNKKVGDYILRKGNMLIEVIPETVSQYTGITDKNGVKIFENDKLRNRRYQDGKPYGSLYKTVKWCNGKFNINGKSKQWEVIGNIFDKENTNANTTN